MTKPSHVFPIEPRDMFVLFEIAKGPVTGQAPLCKALGYDGATLTRSLQRLRQDKFVVAHETTRVGIRGASPHRYEITRKGKAVLTDIIETINELARQVEL